MGMAECPTCGRDDFASERGMKYHHADAHDERIGRNKVTLTCEECGNSYSVRERRKEESKFCSADCRAVGRETRGKERVESVCEWCGEVYSRHPNYIGKFCSRVCHLESKKDGGRSEVECEQCGDVFTKNKAYADRCDNHFCSRDCQGTWYSENRNGEEAPNWRGGFEGNYGPNWRNKRNEVIQRDKYQCQDCGMNRETHKDIFGYDLEVHHIQPFRTFDDSAKANKLSNLITLCTDCHTDRENRAD